MRYVDFVENGFTGRTDFIVTWYSVTNSGLRSNNRFRFQGVKENCIRESMCNILHQPVFSYFSSTEKRYEFWWL
jgi:hypothetical protein